MADIKLSNIATITGTYDSIATALSSEAVITSLISGLTIVKTADKQNWASGYLTYTITVTNNAKKPFEAPTITDTLEPSLITLVADSVKEGETTKEYTYDPTTGVLSVKLETIPVGESVEITFQVQKKS